MSYRSDPGPDPGPDPKPWACWTSSHPSENELTGSLVRRTWWRTSSGRWSRRQESRRRSSQSVRELVLICSFWKFLLLSCLYLEQFCVLLHVILTIQDSEDSVNPPVKETPAANAEPANVPQLFWVICLYQLMVLRARNQKFWSSRLQFCLADQNPDLSELPQFLMTIFMTKHHSELQCVN